MARSISSAYKSALLTMMRRPSVELETLKTYWPKLEQQILSERQRLSSKIGDDDPIRLTIDLLSPLGRTSDETLHTRALAYLFDPSEPHGFGKAVLSAVLSNLPRGTGASNILSLLSGKRTNVVVTSEYRYSVEGSRIRSLARCDIWITLQARKKAALIVIENKIAAREGAGQLGWYEREARKWCKKHKGRSLLVWLAPEKRNASDGWANLSYLELASALRKAWRRNLRAVGRPWLGLYIAAITSGVLGIDINRLHDTPIGDIEAYLGEVPS